MPIYWTYFIQFTVVFILGCWAFYLPLRAGQLYMGPIYCMAIGAYSAGFLTRDLGWPFGLAIIAAMLVSALFGFLPALGLARTRTFPTAMASLALIFIIQTVIGNLRFLGGYEGFWGIPKVEYLMPISLGILLIIGGFIYRLDHSRIGRIIEAILFDPDLAPTLGVNKMWLIVWLQTISAVIGGLAGVIYAFTTRTIYPTTFGFSLLVSMLTMTFLGGRYTMWGVIIVAPILWGLPQWVPQELSEYSYILYASFLILVILFRPEGIINKHVLRTARSSVTAGLRQFTNLRKKE